MLFFRRIQKNISLRLVSLLGLSIIVACLLLSYSYIKKERSYDRFHANAGRIYRMSLQWNDETIDGRIWDFGKIGNIVRQVPEIEEALAAVRAETGVLTYDGKRQVMNNIYFANPNFFNVFSFELLQGDKDKALQSPENVLLSESLAKNLFGDAPPIGKELHLSGRQFTDKTLFVSGVFRDFPETSHFHTDIIAHLPYDAEQGWPYVYLLAKENADISTLKQHLTEQIQDFHKEDKGNFTAHLMPLTDIHLHSHVQKEMEVNGNIYYIYLIAAANVLLLIIVLFNLWFNSRLLFSAGRRYYQLLRLNGASSFTVVRDEALSALLLAALALCIGGFLAYGASQAIGLPLAVLTPVEAVLFCIAFLLTVTLISLLPALMHMSSTLFFNDNNDLKPLYSSSSAGLNVMLTAQYVLVMLAVIMAIGIGRQMRLVHDSQMAERSDNILVMREQPYEVQECFGNLKTELLKHPEITAVTSVMMLPGENNRDGVRLLPEGDETPKQLTVLVVGEDFFPFFDIKPLAGRVFKQESRSMNEEYALLDSFFYHVREKGETLYRTGATEEYIINPEALALLGFNSPQEAIGKYVSLEHNAGLGYIDGGTICGVADFTFSSIHAKNPPTVVMQRNLFQHCIMVRIDPAHRQEAIDTFNIAWQEVLPDFPPNYTFLQDVYNNVYRNELNAERLTNVFSLLCFLIADLGLIIFMAFMIKRRTKEIAIRKINGATSWQIVRMLNKQVLRWIGVAFIIAVPLSYMAMRYWLQHFAYQTPLSWWIFALAGLLVLVLSVISVSLQSYRAATANPADAVKTE